MSCLRRSRFQFLVVIILLVLGGVFWSSLQQALAQVAHPALEDPNAACAACHREISERYRKTPMANASGFAADGLIPADFTHPPSGVHYRVFEQEGCVWLSYERKGTALGGALNGRQQLQFFIGSGKRGRTYLFEQQGYWFESPINWYGKKQLWDMAPNYLSVREMPLTLPVDPGCLHCHASQVARSLPDARNHYAAAPIANGGITCTGCHGEVAAHISSGGKVAMTNLDALEPVRRDSACLRCHLEGQTVVVREGKDLAMVGPGDNLFDYAAYFVRSSETGSGGRATSQWEALLESACKRKSGNRMTCTTCHDPHSSPSAAERVSFYRQRCLQCHNQGAFATSHHPDKPDCAGCHMARAATNDIAHEQVTDHRIVKHPSSSALAASGDLVAVGGMAASDRDLGLAYAQMAAPGDQKDASEAVSLLRHAEKHSSGAPLDHALHEQLGFLDQAAGDLEDAAAEYRVALQADAYDSLAAGNLALIEAQRHHYVEAIRLWETVFAHDPVQIGAGMNLAVVQCGIGRRNAALGTLERLLIFSPDNDQARRMEAAIRSGKQACGK